jgi:hypothetical protein
MSSKSHIVVIAIISSILISAVLEDEILWGRERAGIRDEVERTPMGVLLSMMGGLKELVADILWIKVDDYFHHHIDPSGKGATLLGEKDIMPIIRLQTWLDPHYVKAYVIGGWHLAFNLNRVPEGIRFLEEGKRFNPNEPLIWMELSRIYFFKLKDYAKARYCAVRAMRLSRDKDELASSLWLISRSYGKMGKEKEASFYEKALERVAGKGYVERSLREALEEAEREHEHEHGEHSR